VNVPNRRTANKLLKEFNTSLANFYRTTRRYVPEESNLLVDSCFRRSKVASSKLFRLLIS
jgi:hypothetical protein